MAKIIEKQTFMKTICSLIFISLLFISKGISQNERLYDNQVWFEVLVDYSFGKNFDFYTDASYRQAFSTEGNWRRIMARPSLKWKLLNWLDVRGGIGVFYSDFNIESSILEVRPWQGAAISWPKFDRIKFSHLFRVEQQIIYNTSNWNQKYTTRFRYQLGSRINLRKDRKYKLFFIPVSAEFFFRTDKELNRFLRNDGRYMIGLGYVFNREITVDVKYFVQRSRSEELNFSLSDQVLRLRFRYNMFHDQEDHTKDH